MKLGIIVTCKNSWPYTEAALESIESEHDTLVMVMDDGSTDQTKAELKKWKKEADNRLVFTDPPFDSLAGKWNAGVRKAWEHGCDYAAVLNNDILLHTKTLDRMAERLAEGDVVLVSAHNIEGTFTEKGIPPEFITSGEWELPEQAGEAECPDFSCFMLSKDCWETVGEFDTRYVPAFFEDNDYHERILRAGLKAVNLASAPYYHYGSITVDQDQSEARHERFRGARSQFYHKWGFIPAGHSAVGKMGPIRLLCIGDGARPTGFARVTHSILERLHATGDYEIHHLAINHRGDPAGVPWSMYPAQRSEMEDQFGKHRVNELYKRVNPDVVFMVQDPWHIADYVQLRHGMKGLVAYYPVDSPNLHPNWALHLARCVEVCTYTRFGAEQTANAARLAFDQMKNELVGQMGDQPTLSMGSVRIPGSHDPNYQVAIARLHELQDTSNYNIVPHGVDHDVFFPVEKEIARRRMSIPERAFVVGYVHRNQPRKRQDLMLRTFAKFIKGVRDDDIGTASIDKLRATPIKIRDAVLIVHAALDHHNGWDLEELARSYGVTGYVQFTKGDGEYMPASDLNMLYNCFDVNANVGGGEGWGLSHFESGVSGVAQMVPDWSATAEIWDGRAELVPVAEVRHETYHLNTMQGVVDSDAAADALVRLYESESHREKLGEKAREFCGRDEYTWDSVAEKFDGIIKRAAHIKGVPHNTVTLKRKEAA